MYLSFFHVLYNLFERATHPLLGFLKTLLCFLSTLTGAVLLKEIASFFPKTLFGIRTSTPICFFSVCCLSSMLQTLY